MFLEVTYSDEKWKNARELNVRMAVKYGGIDEAKAYCRDDIPDDFIKRNQDIFKIQRGAGCYLWKPWVVAEGLKRISEGDYLVYIDAGVAVIANLHPLILALESSGQDVMCFYQSQIEKYWTKRDAFILMDCDTPEFTDTPQRSAHVILCKKTAQSIKIIDDWLKFAQDARIITDWQCVMGKPDYEGFVENRFDQTVWSLTTKKYGLKPFRLPFAEDRKVHDFQIGGEEKQAYDRSLYPKLMDIYHSRHIRYEWQLRSKRWRLFEAKLGEFRSGCDKALSKIKR